MRSFTIFTSHQIFFWRKIKKTGWVGLSACMGERRGAYRIFVGKPDGKRLLRRPRHILEDNSKMDLQGMGWRGMDVTGLTQVRDRWWDLVNAVMNFHVPLDAGNFLTSSGPVSFSRMSLLHGVK